MALILFGVKRTHASTALPSATTCPRCHNRVHYRYRHTRRWLTIWFIPILPLGSTHKLVCSICPHAIALMGREVRHARRGELRLLSDDEGPAG